MVPINLISGGVPAQANEFPWYVYILSTGNQRASTCGGSILSETWILTAAHCIVGLNESVDLYFGSTNVYTFPVIISANHSVAHEGYNAANNNNDIAVVQLESALNFTPGIQPITLIPLSDINNDLVDKVATVMGFGYTSDVNPQESTDLLYTRVSIISNDVCKEYYDADIVADSVICAKGYTSKNDSICHADSGGPMVIKNDADQYIQVGIDAFVSTKGCTVGYPSGYVRVGSFLEWISKQTGIPITG